MRPTAFASLARGLLRGDGLRFGFAQTIATQLVVNLVYMVTGVVTARLLGPDGRGVLAAITLWPQLLAAVALAGLPFAVTYHLRNAAEPDRGSVLGAGLLLAAASALLCLGLGIPAIAWTMSGAYPAETVRFAQLFALMMLPSLLSMLGKQSFGALGHIQAFNFASWAEPSLNLLLLVAVVLTMTLTPELAAACLLVEAVLMAAWIGWRLAGICRPRLRLRDRWLGEVGSYAIRASGTGVLANLALYLDRLVLVALVAPVDFGLYVVAFNLSRLVMVIHTALGAVVLPSMTGVGVETAKAIHDRAFRLVALAVAMAVPAAAVLGSPVLTLLYGDDFAAAYLVLVILVGEAALTCLCQVTAQLFLAVGRPGFASSAQAVSFVTAAIGMVVLVPMAGVVGAAVAVVLGAVVRLLVLLAGVTFRLGLPAPRLAPIVGELGAYMRSLRQA
ncbi:MAG TPA: oligosaccharide flippase family protein [Geminicoccaceae bacterium]|nr:oligosaccharide flippase family protein [Geminicoccus sp.]HMU51152.1 oligosaccharide flippase family protein [Geminicoccaceae bacterium]